MIPVDIRLYTWIDVEDVLIHLQHQGGWPQGVVWARAYWDALTVGVHPGTGAHVLDWLRTTFAPRFSAESDTPAILLESTSDQPRRLSVTVEATEEEPAPRSFMPSLRRPGLLWSSPSLAPAPSLFSDDLPPVVAFHSFKGGVGRTLHAVAFAKVLASDRGPVLLVDGDLEAPGISWLLRDRFPHPSIALADVLALAHGDTTPGAMSTVQLAADRIQQMLHDNVFVLPAFRSLEQFTALEIHPEHLIQGADDPFLLTRLLADIGKAIGAPTVLVDLRAGLSELATGLLLDPRVYRVFVTTLSGQSVDGTCKMLELVGTLAPSRREEDPLPAFIMAQVPEDLRGGELVSDTERRLLEAAHSFIADDDIEPRRVITSFESNLLALPRSWEEVMTRLQRTSLMPAMQTLADWLPTGPTLQEERQAVTPPLPEQRGALRDVAEHLEYAEMGTEDDFLVTAALRRLASDHRAQVPIVVVIGAKGAGKTYTFLQVLQRQTWQGFVQATGVRGAHLEAVLCPLLASMNLHESAQALVQHTQQTAAMLGGFATPRPLSALRDAIRDGLQMPLHQGQWRERWLDIIAWSAGYLPGQAGVGADFITALRHASRRLVMVVDGLEDVFQAFATVDAEQIALRALLQDVPDWLRQQPGLPLGLLVFVRRDIVVAAVRQNAAQLTARYEPYVLQWDRDEVLRLVAWVVLKAQVNLQTGLAVETLRDKEEHELIEALVPLWGRKLGSDRSREGRSAEWVIAALSDLKGQIQARDLIRFMRLAAEESQKDSHWMDRLLAPAAIRSVLPECSRKKIEEIEMENMELKAIFSKLRALPRETRQIPFTRADVSLQSEEIATLEANGVVLQEDNEYYLPEIFRLGLNFERAAGARPRILALARRAAR